ncbi:MAG: radical SAM protein [Bacteroidales bacterium]|nr:radical SAM protein [Bacteroidales bacterium]
MGGGYVNTELRQLTEKRIFDYTNYICLDDGERPLYHLAERIINKKTLPLVRTFCISDNEIEYNHDAYLPDFQHSEIGTPSFEGLQLNKYLSLIEMVNPMHRLWSDGRWNKLQIAHGCYWGQCTFCDTSLDYIKRFSTASAKELCNRIENIILQTGQTGFHFVDEAAPPRVLKELAIELIEREINISWWANIRFEEYFDYDICELLAASGCIAVSGGIEVASPRILQLINKGVSLETLIKVTNNFSTNNIMVHGYLMYGFPSQTMQETIDSLEVVRQMFLNNCLHSAFWHQFIMTIHSPVGKKPQQFGAIRLDNQLKAFANNDLKHADETKIDHSIFSDGLKKALYNYMHNNGLDMALHEWFKFKIPPTTIPSKYVIKVLKQKKAT